MIVGEDSFETEVFQHGICFRLDFSKVFWNSRLEFEHQRLVNKYFRPGQLVIDIMAGIGPFSVPAAKMGCRVLANDLNPDSFKWLQVIRIAPALSCSTVPSAVQHTTSAKGPCTSAGKFSHQQSCRQSAVLLFGWERVCEDGECCKRLDNSTNRVCKSGI